MEKQYLQFKVAEATKEKITIVASDETLDRYNEVVPLDKWDLKNYKKNPVLLVDHDYRVGAIVGRAKNLKLGDKQFTFEPEFHDITQAAKEVQAMVDAGFAPAVSVGFLPHAPKKDGDVGMNELLEISFVAVGANPNALALANAMKSISDAEIKKVEAWMEPDEKTAAGESELPDEKKELIETVASLTGQVAELKEGRVLSGKTRSKIENCSSALKQAATLLDDLLLETTSEGKSVPDNKGRTTGEEHGPRKSVKTPSAVVRVLQSINRESNRALKEIKE